MKLTFVYCCILQLLIAKLANAQSERDSSISRSLSIHRQNNDNKHFLLSASMGYGYRPANLPDDLNSVERDYYSKLRNGFYYAFEGAVFFKGKGGAGVIYSNFKTDNSIDNVTVYPKSGPVLTGTVADEITISAIGIQGYYKLWNKNHNALFCLNAGLNYLDYNNKATVITPFIIQGNTVGINIGFTYFLLVSPEFLLGPFFNYETGVLSEYTIDDGQNVVKYKFKENEGESMNHLGIGIKGAYTF